MSLHPGRDYYGPYGEPLFGMDRWKVEIPNEQGGFSVKGLSEADAQEAARTYGGRVFRSWAWVFPNGQEVLDPWLEVDLWA